VRKIMTNEEIKALLEMIEPSDNPPYKGGQISYETAKEWADELIELRATKDKMTFDGNSLSKEEIDSILDERMQILKFISSRNMLGELYSWMKEKGYK
jgi:hypothetical protein